MKSLEEEHKLLRSQIQTCIRKIRRTERLLDRLHHERLELLEKFREIDYQLAMETKRTIVKRPTLKSDEQIALEKLSRLTKEELQALIDAINLKRKGSNL